jgi:hypothetical protein
MRLGNSDNTSTIVAFLMDTDKDMRQEADASPAHCTRA